MDFTSYIKPELLIVVAVLYVIGMFLKNSIVADKYIPWILLVIGLLLCVLWVFATSQFVVWQDLFIGLFTAITQGALVTGGAVLVNQLIKQTTKKENN